MSREIDADGLVCAHPANKTLQLLGSGRKDDSERERVGRKILVR